MLEVAYLVFNEGYSATAGDDWIRPALCEEALRLGRILAELMPREPDVHALVALMEIQASRLRARTGPSGEPILLLDQDRGRWDQLLVRRGLTALDRAEALGGPRGPYALQAAIAACHARARTAPETDWVRIAALYARRRRTRRSHTDGFTSSAAVTGPSARTGPQRDRSVSRDGTSRATGRRRSCRPDGARASRPGPRPPPTPDPPS